MVKNGLFQYHFDDINKYEGVEVVECNGAGIIHMHLTNDIIEREFKYPCRINAFVAMMCVSGEVSFSTHISEHTLREHMCFCTSSTIVQFTSCRDCELYILAFRSDFIASQHLDITLLAPLLSELQNCVVIDLPTSQAFNLSKSFTSAYNQLATRETSPFSSLILGCAFSAIIYRVAEELYSITSIKPVAPKDRSAEYFERLMKLIAEHFRTERSVEFYANKMNLTPKHLSRVIRDFTGRSVHQWIDNVVILEIKNLLRYSDMSIQQISYSLNFANPSFMGQYFKRLTGKTPGEYKRER